MLHRAAPYLLEYGCTHGLRREGRENNQSRIVDGEVCAHVGSSHCNCFGGDRKGIWENRSYCGSRLLAN